MVFSSEPCWIKTFQLKPCVSSWDPGSVILKVITKYVKRSLNGHVVSDAHYSTFLLTLLDFSPHESEAQCRIPGHCTGSDWNCWCNLEQSFRISNASFWGRTCLWGTAVPSGVSFWQPRPLETKGNTAWVGFLCRLSCFCNCNALIYCIMAWLRGTDICF